jgi:hypothetical protein
MNHLREIPNIFMKHHDVFVFHERRLRVRDGIPNSRDNVPNSRRHGALVPSHVLVSNRHVPRSQDPKIPRSQVPRSQIRVQDPCSFIHFSCTLVATTR